MPTGQLASALRQLRHLFTGGTASGLTDRQLLDRFADRRAASAEAATEAEMAFAALMDRHGAMVWGVCRRVLGDAHEAEDAFQATFLVLVRKAGSIRVDDSLGRWLYGVAVRVAHRARSEARRRADRRGPAPGMQGDDPASAAERGDLRNALGEELDRLPARYRGPIELCDLQGLSYDQAARQLDWPSTTVKSRLARGRVHLRERLARRGLAPAAMAATAALARDARAAVPPGLIPSTIRAATSRAAGVFPASAVALGHGVLTTMKWQKIKLLALGALALAGLAEAARSRALPIPVGGDGPAQAPAAAKADPAEPKRIADLIAKLKIANVDAMHPWAEAVRDLVAIGRPAVPPLIEELDKTTDPMTLRSLGFTLRALGDPRAVPALIRAIPRTLTPGGSDYGLEMGDADLRAFLQKHDLDKGNGGRLFTFGMPYREVTGALRALTGKQFSEDELNFINLEGGPAQRRLKLGLFQRLAGRWAAWWEGDWRRFTDDPAYARVNLPPPPPALPEAVPAALQPFPTGSRVKASSGWAGAIVGPPQALAYYRTFMDLDTGRDLKWPDALGRPEDARPDAVSEWAAREGYDLEGVEYRPPGSDRSYYAIRGLNLRAWQIDDGLYGKIEWELHFNRVPPLDRPANELLMDYDPATKTYRPEAGATFLFVTREGATGALKVEGQVTQLHGERAAATDPKGLRGFYRGVQYGYKLVYDEPDPLADPRPDR